MRIYKFSLITALSLLFLSGCFGGYKTWGDFHASSYSPQQFGYFNQNKDLLTIVFGNPFNEDKKSFDRAVTDAMQGRNAGGTTNFNSEPSDTNHPDTYFAIQFNPDMTKLGNNFCRRQQALDYVDPADGSVNMIMAYCENGNAASYIKGSATAASSMDESFTGMIGRAVQIMIPIRNPNDNSNSCRSSGSC